MLLKLKKSQSSIDLDDLSLFNTDIEVLEIVSKFPLSIKGQLSVFSNLRSLTINAPKLVEASLNFSNCDSLKILKFKNTPISNGLQIKGLNLETLQLSNTGLYILPPWVCQMTTLKMLDINSNELEGLPNEMEWLKSLTRLNLDSNKFKEIPRVLLTLPKLGHLSTDGNDITESQRQEFIKEKNS